MRDLDETDLEILQLLMSNARRPYSDIADIVSLSAPAVSDLDFAVSKRTGNPHRRGATSSFTR